MRRLVTSAYAADGIREGEPTIGKLMGKVAELVTLPISWFSHNLDDEEWMLIFDAVKRVDFIG
jgi:hypothetical protein